ncbi:hypothetical protein M8818_005050 [Zalaria obscura]|uniref:Uncharacterized protein n=1 Tax=Zalaria obscura TaxID=2024903 RepID=A0ACC3SAV3_9PEZI
MMRYTTALIVETKREVQRTFVRVALAGSRLRTGGNVDPGGDPLKLGILGLGIVVLRLGQQVPSDGSGQSNFGLYPGVVARLDFYTAKPVPLPCGTINEEITLPEVTCKLFGYPGDPREARRVAQGRALSRR